MKIYIDRVEFYITNVCNFNCDNCNRLNNYYFSGHQLWKDYSDVYAKWADELDIGQITILGGEPLLNPSFLDWVNGIRLLWPAAKIEVITNGTRLGYWKNLYSTLHTNKVDLVVTVHNQNRYSTLISEVETLLQLPVVQKFDNNFSDWATAYNQVRDASWPNCSSVDDYKNLPKHIQDECQTVHGIDPDSFLKNTNTLRLTDINQVKVSVVRAEGFVTAPLRYNADRQQFEIYNSDPKQAHDVCISKHCHHFIRGKLYKCHHVALLPEFMKQFDVNISSEDQLLLNSYQPLEVSSNRKKEFIDQIKNQIPQCKLCPSVLNRIDLESSTKKPKVPKKVFKIQELR
jgi:hypothetical protein